MRRQYTLLSLLTALVVAAAVYGGYMNFRPAALPIEINIRNIHTAVIEPIDGIPLPAGIQAGDRIDLAVQPRATRIAITINSIASVLQGNLPPGKTYDFVIQRGDAVVTLPITTLSMNAAAGMRFIQSVNFVFLMLAATMALLTLWRGRDRAAAGMALWTIAIVVAAADVFPLDGVAGLAVVVSANLIYFFARVGFYIMADAIARPMLTTRVRAWYLGSFILILLAGALIFSLGGNILYVTLGWPVGFLSWTGILWSASYLIPVMLLFASYRHAHAEQRLRLRWMLWSSVAWLISIVISNTHFFGQQLTLLTLDSLSLLSIAGFVYAVLRHRVVDVSVLLDRTLVYGAVTALVVGVLAAVNSLVQHAALGTSASLLLQVVVPLSLGIVLTRVRSYMDRIVERVFFRKRYLADRALRRFARLCNRFERADELMGTAITDIRQYLGARGVAIYERGGKTYVCVRQQGEVVYPQHVKIDDTAFVAARADQNDIDLTEFHSALGSDGYAFPMAAHGELQEVLVCANRPGEHYAVDERQLLAHVAQQMGMALYALRMGAKAKLVEALVTAPLVTLPEVQSQARTLLGADTTA